MNYISYVTYFGNVFCIFIGNINQEARNDRNSVYIVIEIIKNVLRKKTPRLFNVAVCNIRPLYTRIQNHGTFNSDNAFVPDEV